MYTRTCVCISICVYICIYKCRYTHPYLSIPTVIYTFVCIYVHIYIYIYITSYKIKHETLLVCIWSHTCQHTCACVTRTYYIHMYICICNCRVDIAQACTYQPFRIHINNDIVHTYTLYVQTYTRIPNFIYIYTYIHMCVMFVVHTLTCEYRYQ